MGGDVSKWPRAAAIPTEGDASAPGVVVGEAKLDLKLQASVTAIQSVTSRKRSKYAEEQRSKVSPCIVALG